MEATSPNKESSIGGVRCGGLLLLFGGKFQSHSSGNCIHNFYTQTDQHLYHCFNITMAALSNDNHEATTNIDSTKNVTVGVEMKQQLFHEKGEG